MSLDVQVLHELVGDKSLERFCVEYEKLFQAVRKSHGRIRPTCFNCIELACCGLTLGAPVGLKTTLHPSCDVSATAHTLASPIPSQKKTKSGRKHMVELVIRSGHLA